MLLDYEAHRQMQTYVKALNAMYLANKQLWENDMDWQGFEWISHDDNRNNMIAFRPHRPRTAPTSSAWSTSPRSITRATASACPIPGTYEEIFSSDEVRFGGSGVKNGKVRSKAAASVLPKVIDEETGKLTPAKMHGYADLIDLEIAPLSVIYLKGKPRVARRAKATPAGKTAKAESKTADSRKSDKKGEKPRTQAARRTRAPRPKSKTVLPAARRELPPRPCAQGGGAGLRYISTSEEKRRVIMYRKKECVAMLLAGGQGSRLYVLTTKVAKPAVPFGGKYRIIDFPLSNCVNSGIDTVGVLTQYEPHALNAYIGSGQTWDLDRNARAASTPCRPISAARRGLVQGHGKRHLSEHRLHRGV